MREAALLEERTKLLVEQHPIFRFLGMVVLSEATPEQLKKIKSNFQRIISPF